MRCSSLAPRVREWTSSLPTTIGCTTSRYRAFSSSCRWIGYPSERRLPRQLLENLFPQLLRLAEELLILDEQTVHLQRFVSRQLLAQHHVAHMHGVRQDCIFGQFFQRDIGIVVIHRLSRSRFRNWIIG